MNLYHDHGITYNFWGLWILQLSICLNKKGALKTDEKRDWSARQHLNNEFYGHLLSFLLYDFLPTRHFWQWERNSYYSSDNREQREQTGGSDSLTGGCGLDWVLTTAALSTPWPSLGSSSWSESCSQSIPRILTSLARHDLLQRLQDNKPDRWRMWAEFWTPLWFKEKMRVASW